MFILLINKLKYVIIIFNLFESFYISPCLTPILSPNNRTEVTWAIKAVKKQNEENPKIPVS